MKNFIWPIGVLAASVVMTTGCVDKDYDLSDIDSTVQVNINDLVIPVNLKPVELSALVDVDPSDDPNSDEEFRYDTTTGDYYFRTSGDFNSEDVKLGAIHYDAVQSQNNGVTIPMTSGVEAEIKSMPGVDLSQFDFHFDYRVDEIDENIRSVISAAVDFTLHITLGADPDKVTFRDMVFALPKALTVDKSSRYSYEPSTGLLTVPGKYKSLDLDIHATGINLKEAGATIVNNSAERYFRFPGVIGVNGGKVSTTDYTGNATMSVGFSLSPLTVNSITGVVTQNFNIDTEKDRISLEEIPDELRQEGTKLALTNPQIYITVSNPMYNYGICAVTGLNIFQWRYNAAGELKKDTEYSASLASEVEITNKAEYQKFCLSPIPGFHDFIAGYTDAKPLLCNNLGHILYGDGLPQELSVEFVNPRIPENTHVTDLPLGRSVGEVTGSYEFYAPLSLVAGSAISYSDDDKDWDWEDADDLHISLLEVTADYDNEIPLTVELSALPLDKEGNIIDASQLRIEEARVEADSHGTVTIRVTGDITGLDGIRYKAKVIASDSERTLNRNMKITLNNIKAKVNGHYTTTL